MLFSTILWTGAQHCLSLSSCPSPKQRWKLLKCTNIGPKNILLKPKLCFSKQYTAFLKFCCNTPAKGCQPSVTVLYQGLAALGLGKYIGQDASSTEMYLGLPALSYCLVPRAGSLASPGLAALGPKKYIGRAASGTEMYLGLPALSYRLVPRAGSPACPGLAALGPE